MGYRDHMYALSSKSGSEPFNFARFWSDLRWNDPIALWTGNGNHYKMMISKFAI